MPTYDYDCKTCGHRFEHFQSITSDALTHCVKEECIQEDEEKKGTGVVVRRVSGGAGLVFKGEGFYLTDYGRKGSDAKTGGSVSSPSGGKSESGGSSSSGGASGSSSGGSSSGSSSESGGTSGGKSSGSSGGSSSGSSSE